MKLVEKKFEDHVPHIVALPLEDLPHHLHVVNPDVHHRVNSKAFITQIDCPQVHLY